eukprot:gb/GEZJ01007263.1/.p1 GENE.gb/GEZJ01007263.1/~~gb/GEZJ01007263.1/.p1  ORF type:complete len:113 (+),score=12.78 gb/GEZJ01007263.1/:282-620(+)
MPPSMRVQAILHKNRCLRRHEEAKKGHRALAHLKKRKPIRTFAAALGLSVTTTHCLSKSHETHATVKLQKLLNPTQAHKDRRTVLEPADETWIMEKPIHEAKHNFAVDNHQT